MAATFKAVVVLSFLLLIATFANISDDRVERKDLGLNLGGIGVGLGVGVGVSLGSSGSGVVQVQALVHLHLAVLVQMVGLKLVHLLLLMLVQELEGIMVTDPKKKKESCMIYLLLSVAIINKIIKFVSSVCIVTCNINY